MVKRSAQVSSSNSCSLVAHRKCEYCQLQMTVITVMCHLRILPTANDSHHCHVSSSSWQGSMCNLTVSLCHPASLTLLVCKWQSFLSFNILYKTNVVWLFIMTLTFCLPASSTEPLWNVSHFCLCHMLLRVTWFLWFSVKSQHHGVGSGDGDD